MVYLGFRKVITFDDSFFHKFTSLSFDKEIITQKGMVQ